MQTIAMVVKHIAGAVLVLLSGIGTVLLIKRVLDPLTNPPPD